MVFAEYVFITDSLTVPLTNKALFIKLSLTIPISPADTPEITLSSSARVVYGDTLTLSVAASFLTTPPSVHWAVNGVVTGSSSVTMATQNSLTSALMWPVTRDMEVTATVHQYDLGVVTTATKTIIPSGECRLENKTNKYSVRALA